MVYSFFAGLCFGASLFLLVLYMPRYNRKQLVKAVISWAVMGVMCIIGFISAFNQAPSKSAASAAPPIAAPSVVPSAPVAPSVTPTPPPDDQKYFSTDIEKFSLDYDAKNSDDTLTEVQMDDFKKQFEDKLVKWSGVVKDVSYTSDGDSICMDLTYKDIDFTVFFSEGHNMEVLKGITKGQNISVEGTTHYFVDWYLDDARLLEK